MFKIALDTEVIEINEKEKELMVLVGDVEAIEGKNMKVMPLNDMKAEDFKRVQQCLKIKKYDLKKIGKIKNSDASEYIGTELTEYLTTLSWKDINGIYTTAHRLKIENLRNNVAAFMACKVYVPLDIAKLNEKKEELGIKNELTSEKSAQYRDKYPFLS